jgi:hypothetical protein
MPGDTIEISKIQDKAQFNDNFDNIDWSTANKWSEEYGSKQTTELKKTKKHITAGMCGEYGMSIFDEKAFKSNYELIKWNEEKAKEEVITERTQPIYKFGDAVINAAGTQFVIDKIFWNGQSYVYYGNLIGVYGQAAELENDIQYPSKEEA